MHWNLLTILAVMDGGHARVTEAWRARTTQPWQWWELPSWVLQPWNMLFPSLLSNVHLRQSLRTVFFNTEFQGKGDKWITCFSSLFPYKTNCWPQPLHHLVYLILFTESPEANMAHPMCKWWITNQLGNTSIWSPQRNGVQGFLFCTRNPCSPDYSFKINK